MINFFFFFCGRLLIILGMKLGLVSICLVLVTVAGSRGDYTKFFDKCTKEKNTFDCLKRRALDVLDRAINDDSVYVINDYVSIAKDSAAIDNDKSSSEYNNTALSIDEKLDRKFHEYLSSRSIKLTIPGDAIQGN